LAWIRHHGGVAEDILINIIERNEGNDLYLHYRRELVEIINLTNHMNNCNIQVDESAERVATFLLPPRPDQIIVPDFSVKDAPDIDKSMQLSKDQDFTLDGTKKRMKERTSMTIDYHIRCMELSQRLEGDPKMLHDITDSYLRVSKGTNRRRPRKNIYSQPENKPTLKRRSNSLSRPRKLLSQPDYPFQEYENMNQTEEEPVFFEDSHNFEEEEFTDPNQSPQDSEDDDSQSPTRVDRANHDKNLSSAGAIPFKPKKGSLVHHSETRELLMNPYHGDHKGKFSDFVDLPL
jgi:hypothetical protein